MIKAEEFGRLLERVEHLVKGQQELKEECKVNFNKVETGFKDLNKCIESKFTKHNDYHINVEKKYIRWFLILGALTIGSVLSNPENAKFVWGLLVKFTGVF